MPIPAFFYSDSSLAYGNDTPKYFLTEAKAKGYQQACIVDFNTTASSINHIDSAAALDMSPVVGLTASVCCPKRDRDLWRQKNYKKCKQLFSIISSTDEKHFDYDIVVSLSEALKGGINSKVKLAKAKEEVARLLGDLTPLVFEKENLQKIKKMLKHIDKTLPIGSLTFVAKNETGYKSILYLNSAIGKRKSDNIKQGEDEPVALTLRDIEEYAKDVFIVDSFQKGSYLEPFSSDPDALMSLPYFDIIDVLGVPFNNAKALVSLAAKTTKIFAPFPQFNLSKKEDYNAYCVKIAVHTKIGINSFNFEKPSFDCALVSQDKVNAFYTQNLDFLGVNYDAGFWDELGGTPVTLGEIHLPNFDMPIQKVVSYAFAKEQYEGPDFNTNEEALAAFEAWIEPSMPEKMTLSKYRQKRLNDFCLHSLACEGMEKRLIENFGEDAELHRESYKTRLESEFEVIESMGFSGYFLIEFESVEFARNNDIPVAPGRGSAAGSFIVYCIEVTDVDPIKYDLQFERFLNPERVSMPDIDTDFGEGRDKVLKFISEKYQQPGVKWPSSSQIANINRYQLKSSIAAVRGAYGLSMRFDADLKKLILDAENELGITEPKSISWDELLGLDFVKSRMNREPMLAKVLLMSRSLTGKTQSYGVHAGGVVISPTTICDFSAVWSDDKGNFFCLYDKDNIERAGLIKFDFLGLKTLNVTQEAVRQIKENHGIDVNLRRIDFDDPAVYGLISQQVLCDIFQLGSKGIRQLVGSLKPSNMEELAVLSALFRPGALQSEMDKDYIAVKNGMRPAAYDHPALESVTNVTFGCIVYQEQVMSIVRALANYSLGEADLLRRAMGKKKIAEMTRQRNVYSKRALEYWRDHYLKIGEGQMFDFPLDVNFNDAKDEMRRLGIEDCLDKDGFISDSDDFLKAMKILLKMSDGDLETLKNRTGDYSYVVKLFKEHYQGAIDFSVTSSMEGDARQKEMSIRVYYALSQYVRFNQIFNKVEKFAGYGFNKSHAVAYSLVTYMTAWLKTYYPAEFYAASMTFMKRDAIHESVIEASQKMGVQVLPPDINLSRERFRAESARKVRYGFAKLSEMGSAAGTIIKEREAGGDYLGIYDFIHRMDKHAAKPSASAFVSIAVSGGFDKFIPKRIQRDPDTNGRQYNVWLRDRLYNGKAFKEKEAPSFLHNMVDDMSEHEFAAYLTVSAGITYSKKIQYNASEAMKKEIKQEFVRILHSFNFLCSSDDLGVVNPELMSNFKGVSRTKFLNTLLDSPRIGLDELECIVSDQESDLEDESSRPISIGSLAAPLLSQLFPFYKGEVLECSPLNLYIICGEVDSIDEEALENDVRAFEEKFIEFLWEQHGEEFTQLLFAGFVGRMNVTYSKISDVGDDDYIEDAKNRLGEDAEHHPAIRVSKELLNRLKTPFEKHFLLVLDVIVSNHNFLYENLWSQHLKDVLDQPVADTLNKERDACGFYLTSTPIKVLKIAARVEREPPGHLIDGCPVKVSMIDGSHDGQKVTTYGVVRNIFLTTVKNEMSDSYGEKMMFFDLEDGADKLSCMIIGNKAVQVLHQKVVSDGVVCMICGKVSMNDRGISMKPAVLKRYHPVEDDKLHKVPRPK